MLLASSAADLDFSCAAYGIRAVRGDYALARNLSWTRREFARRGRVVCETAAGVPSALRIRGQRAAGVADGWYDRRGALRCAEWSFAKGDPWTIVAFHEPRWGGDAHFKQHTELWMFVDGGGPRSECSLPDWFGERANLCREDTEVEARTADEVPYFFSLLPHPATAFLQLGEGRQGQPLPPLLTLGLPAAVLAAGAVLLRRRARRRLYTPISEPEGRHPDETLPRL